MQDSLEKCLNLESINSVRILHCLLRSSKNICNIVEENFWEFDRGNCEDFREDFKPHTVVVQYISMEFQRAINEKRFCALRRAWFYNWRVTRAHN